MLERLGGVPARRKGPSLAAPAVEAARGERWQALLLFSIVLLVQYDGILFFCLSSKQCFHVCVLCQSLQLAVVQRARILAVRFLGPPALSTQSLCCYNTVHALSE